MDGHFNNKQYGVSWMARKEMSLDAYLTSYTQINSREIINLTAKVKAK